MGKFKFHFRIQGLELDVEGTREDIPAISQGVASQIAGLLESSGDMLNGEPHHRTKASSPIVISQSVEPKKKSRRKKSTGAASANVAEASEVVLVWQHDPQKYAAPTQNWNTARKSMWLLYVANKAVSRNSLTAKQITESFNKMFRQTGEIKSFNVTRDLGKLKSKGKEAPVAEDNSKDPAEWYLTETGIREMQGLIANPDVD